jgi:dipeptidyl aminopeptidase/acylaminoacyl peptidase
MDEQRLERALRQGPPFATEYVPASLGLDEQPTVRGPSAGRLVLIIAVTALLLVGMLAGLAALGAFRDDDRGASNGWIAFARSGSGPRGASGWVERDIYLVREGEAAHRIVGSDAEILDQVCPAFSPDGRRLAHGEAEGTAGDGYRDAALVISALDAAGNASESLRIDVGGTFPPPCATWSADGRRVAFAFPFDPDRSEAGSEVWVATVADGHVNVVSDLPASDLEWSPDGSQLAIAIGQTDGRQSVGDGSIRLYDADRGEMRTLVGPGPWGVWRLTWSPDGGRIAYQRGRSDGGDTDQEIWVVRVDGSGGSRLSDPFGAIYGAGPVWSPMGDRIVYQRMKHGGTEAHDVVLVTPDDGSEVVVPDLRLPGDDASVSRRPDSVTWSPDGNELLYTVWVSGRPGRALISLSLNPGSEPVVLYEGVDAGAENRSWGSRPDE